MIRFPLFLALRYLRPRGSFVSAITMISIIGVMLGVLVLVVVISVMSGFERKIKEMVLGYEPHVEIYHDPPEIPPEVRAARDRGEDAFWEPRPSNWREFVSRLEEVPGVTKVAPLIRTKAVLEFQNEIAPAQIKALRPEDYPPDSALGQEVLAGSLDLRLVESVVLPLPVANQLGVSLYDKVTLYTSNNIGQIVEAAKGVQESGTPEEERTARERLESVVFPVELEVVGIFQRTPQNIAGHVVVPSALGDELLQLQGEITSIGVWTTNPDLADVFAHELVEHTPVDWYLVPWMKAPGVDYWFRTIRAERFMMYVVLFSIVLVAAFSIMNTIITVTVQKRREIGMITALGGRAGQVMTVFLLKGGIVGLIGSLLGLGFGLLVVQYRNELAGAIQWAFGFNPFDARTYGVAEIPAEIRASDLSVITIGSFLICLVAALPPAWFAARVDPAKALRGE